MIMTKYDFGLLINAIEDVVKDKNISIESVIKAVDMAMLEDYNDGLDKLYQVKYRVKDICIKYDKEERNTALREIIRELKNV